MGQGKKFEVALYNKEVRQLVRQGDKHRHLRDDWAEIHYIEISGADEIVVRNKIESRYPEEDGFVVEQVVLVRDDDD